MVHSTVIRSWGRMPSPVWHGHPGHPAFSPRPHPSRSMSAASRSMTPGIPPSEPHAPGHVSSQRQAGHAILTESPTRVRVVTPQVAASAHRVWLLDRSGQSIGREQGRFYSVRPMDWPVARRFVAELEPAARKGPTPRPHVDERGPRRRNPPVPRAWVRGHGRTPDPARGAGVGASGGDRGASAPQVTIKRLTRDRLSA
jgi:hypothetical protein